MKQKTFEITNHLTYKTGIHNVLLGTHNELYNIDYGFVNALNGRISYKNLDAFFASKPTRIRGAHPFNGDNRETLFNNLYTHYNVNIPSLYLQDEINLGRLRLSSSTRIDYTDLPNKPQLSLQVNTSPNDPNFRNTYTPLNQLINKYFSKPTLCPRLGFNLDKVLQKKICCIKRRLQYFCRKNSICMSWICILQRRHRIRKLRLQVTYTNSVNHKRRFFRTLPNDKNHLKFR